MVKLVAALAVAVLFCVGAARAQGLPEALDEALDKAIAKNPERFLAVAEDLVAGFGGPEGLTLAGIEEHVALERASARASAMRRLLAMDLDGDGSVAREELQVVQRAASAVARGRLERQFAAADRDKDGAIGAAEMRADAEAAALKALGEAEADVLRALMALDSDGNGALTLAELRVAVPADGEAT